MVTVTDEHAVLRALPPLTLSPVCHLFLCAHDEREGGLRDNNYTLALFALWQATKPTVIFFFFKSRAKTPYLSWHFSFLWFVTVGIRWR